jgi:predicted TIM-barrel fold metal-dependent hydrolase
MYIDADTHADESVETWSYFPEAMSHLRPGEMVFADDRHVPPYLSSGKGHDGLQARGLLIDGQIYYRRTRSDLLTRTTVGTRELYDVPLRIQHMDEMGVETQVIYPSLLLEEVTRRPEVEIAICESYNRWISDRCHDTNGRLRWVAVLPLRSMPDTLREMRRVKEQGAVGIFKRGIECGNRRAGDPYFHPMYELAQDLDLSICIHVGHPYTGTSNALTVTQKSPHFSLFVIDAFLSVLLTGTSTRFPRLRFGFVEAAAGWVPWALYSANYEKAHQSGGRASYEEALQESRIFVTCDANEDVSLLVKQLGDDILCVGTDYGHSDRSAIRDAHIEIAKSALPGDAIKKLTDTNARRLYGLP